MSGPVSGETRIIGDIVLPPELSLIFELYPHGVLVIATVEVRP